MQIRHRLTVSYTVLLVFIAAILVVAALRFHQLSTQVKEVVEGDAALVQLAGEINLSAESLAGRLLLLFILEDQKQRVAIYQSIDHLNKKMDAAIAEMKQHTHSEATLQVIDQLITLRADYQKKLINTVEELELGNTDTARKLMAGETLQSLDKLLAKTSKMAADQQASMSRRQSETLGISQQSIYTILALGLGALATGLLMSILITRSIVRPLNGTVAVADQIAAGNLRAFTISKSADEIGLLMQSMGNMRQHLHKIISDIRQHSGQVSQAAEQMSRTANQVKTDSAGQSKMAREINASVAQFSADTTTMAATVQSSRDQAHKARALAHEGVEVIAHASTEITNVAQLIAASADSVTSLTSSSAEVAGAVGRIREIADQTNLLALNASIEAARAGDSGRGFAVVAEEVRNLALRTNEVTAQIDQVISTINTQTEQAANQIKTGKSEMDKSVALIQGIVEPLKTLEVDAEASLNSLERLTSIASAQAQESEVIASRVNHIVEMAEANRDATENLSGLTGGLLQVARESELTVSTFQLS